MKKIKAFFNNPVVVHFIIKLLALIFIIFLIFVKFGPFIKDDNNLSSESISLISPFGLPLYYNIDTFLLSLTFILFFMNYFLKNKNIYKICFVLGILSTISYIISFAFTSIIIGIFTLFIFLYIVLILLLYYSIII